MSYRCLCAFFRCQMTNWILYFTNECPVNLTKLKFKEFTESRKIRWKWNEKCQNHTKYNKMALEIFKKIPKKSPRYPENCQILTFRRKVNHIIIARQQQLPQMDSSFILNSRCAWLRFWLEVWISFKIATSDAGKFSIIRRSFVLAKWHQKEFECFQVWCEQSMYQIFLCEPFFWYQTCIRWMCKKK